ncbi:MAG: subtilisin family serine protease [Crocinitomicaceae bacterium]|jgi:subtilisin family serine protease
MIIAATMNKLNYNQSFIDLPDTLRNNRGKEIKVAILDSGINLEHVAFKDARIECDRTAESYSGTTDRTGHGTHLAGIIAANTEDLTGIAPDAELFISKITTNQANNYSVKDFIRGLSWAIQIAKVDVINLSFALPSIGNNAEITALLDEANAANIIVVASAGENSILKSSEEFFFPALFNQCIAVGGISASFQRKYPDAILSNHLDFFMPKNKIVSCSNIGSQYIPKKGSSMSTAFVSGLVCLIKANAEYPKKVGLKDVKEQLKQIAKNYLKTTDLTQDLTLLKQPL